MISMKSMSQDRALVIIIPSLALGDLLSIEYYEAWSPWRSPHSSTPNTGPTMIIDSTIRP